MAGHPEAVASERVTEVRGLAAGTAETAKAQRKHLLNEVVAVPRTIRFVTAKRPQDKNCSRQLTGHGNPGLALAMQQGPAFATATRQFQSQISWPVSAPLSDTW